MNEFHFVPVEFLSPEYDECVHLRDKVLRKPLKLEFTLDQLEDEHNQFHFALYDKSFSLIGCLSFKVVDSHTLKMRQVAVEKAYQSRGHGTEMVRKAEQWAVRMGYSQIELHARDQAVAFYTKLNYQFVGELFVEVGIPHRTMTKTLQLASITNEKN